MTLGVDLTVQTQRIDLTINDTTINLSVPSVGFDLSFPGPPGPTGPAGAGQTNTGSNVGTDGTGVFDGKVGVDLQFRHVAATTAGGVSVAFDAVDNDIDLAVDVNGMTAATSPDNADTIPIYDNSALAHRKMTRANFLSAQAASNITSGTLVHERGGLEADVSAFSGLVKISGGATSQAVGGTDYANASHNHAASEINSGMLAHERGGIEADISEVLVGNVIAGTGTGSMGLVTGGNDGDLLTKQADGTVAFEAPAASNVYRVWIPLGTTNSQNYQTAQLTTAGQAVYFNFIIPSGFTTFDTARVWLVGIGATGNGQFDCAINWAAVDENYAAASNSILNQVITFTAASDIYAVDISSVFVGPAAGDVVGVKFSTDDTNSFDLYVLGFELVMS